MKKAVLDTSAIISLQIIDILQKSLSILQVYIPKSVASEIKEISKFKDREGLAAKKVLELLSQEKIRIISVNDQDKIKELISKNIDLGESESFVLCQEQNINTLIIDDVDAAYRLESLSHKYEIELKISVSVLIELYKQKVISKQELKSHIEALISLREWEGGVLQTLAKKYLEDI